MRGKATENSARMGIDGITPAYAGKRMAEGSPVPSTRDHPRVCGEKPGAQGLRKGEKGSPPRMRGKGFFLHFLQCQCGITPAYAGKSFHSVPVLHSFRDHPRVCGEKLRDLRMVLSTVGSPPRMRGKVMRFSERPGGFGITPAYAGKSCRR